MTDLPRPRVRARRGAVSGLVLLLLSLACGDAATEEPRHAVSPPEAPSDAPPRGAGGERPAAAEPAENVLLITIDTLRWDAVGFAGADPEARRATPNLDRWAAGGLVFDDAHAHNVVTLPSHANILTGLYPYQHGVRDNRGFVLAPSVPTVATALAQRGFATAAVVGAFPLDGRFGLARGFELYDDRLPEGGGAGGVTPLERRGDEVVARGLEWWRRNADSRRFLWVHLFDPHAPYEAPADIAGRFPGRPYLGEVAAVDAFLQPLLAAAGSAARTLVVFTSDHGEALGDHGEQTHGLFAYEATLKVPLVVRGPGIEPGRSRVPARHVDVAPTILAAVGAPVPPSLPGRSLLDGSAEPGQWQYFEAVTAALDRGWAPLRGVIAGGAKLIALPLPELYELAEDPGEEVNLYARDRERARRLAARLPLESAWPPERGAVRAEDERALRGLGYVGGVAPAGKTYTAADDPKNLVALDRKMHLLIDRYQTGRLAEAERLGRELVAARGDMGVAYYYLAQVLLERGQPGPAIEVMSAARARGVATPALLRQLGRSLAAAGRTAEAIEILTPLAADGDPDSLNALGVVLSEAGAQGEARRVLARVFELDPRNAAAHENLALVALRGGQWEEARRQARLALAESERLDQAWNYLGTALYNLGDKAAAVEAWQRSVAAEPSNFDALFNLALVAGEIGRRDLARQALERFVAEAPPEKYGADIERAKEWLRQGS